MIQVDILTADVVEALADFDAGTFSGVLTDPPYGLGKLGARRLRAMLAAWLDGREATQAAGMLGRKWDVVVGPPTWEEVRRVCRPGALAFAYSHGRTYHYQALAMELAGWRILPEFVRIHGGALALGQDVAKAIDKAAGAERAVIGTRLADDIRGGNSCKQEAERRKMLYEYTAPATPLAHRFDGYASGVRNCLEPIVSAVNPPSGPWARNADEHGCGGFNVGEARIPSGPVDDYGQAQGRWKEGGDRFHGTTKSGAGRGNHSESYSPHGRFPSNVLLEHAKGCGADWCVEGCPVRVLAEMGGWSTARKGERQGVPTGSTYKSSRTSGRSDALADAGTVARFYFRGRASVAERHRGAEGLLWRRAPNHPDGWELVDVETWINSPKAERFEGNPHLAVKAADGGSYLAGLIRPPDRDARLLVPFLGTGSEVIAAMLAGWRRITAIERSPQWVEVAHRRINWWREKVEAGSRGAALEILRDWGTAPGPAPPEDAGQVDLFELLGTP